MAPVHLILPQMPGLNAEVLRAWLKGLPELALIAAVRVQIVPWQKAVTGEIADWISTVKAVTASLPEAAGVVVWAPEQSLLSLAGALSLALPHPGKPVICFAGDYPTAAAIETEPLMGLKSLLINASFTATADLGEVLVMHESKLFKPSSCQWDVIEGQLRITASEAPVAVIDFSLRLQGNFRRRDKATSFFADFDLSPRVQVASWFPGVEQAKIKGEKTDALVLLTDAQYWAHPDVQSLRRELQERELATVWCGRTPWNVKLAKHEVAVTHSQPWWVVLATQASFGSLSDQGQALKHVLAVTS